LGIPFLLLLVIYIMADPFKTNNAFHLSEVNTINREYLSTELYLKNEKKLKYDSFIFGSSKACGINTYKWKSYLPAGSSQFLFQAWAETITGIYQKLAFLDKRNVAINNVVILLDIPASFGEIQEPTTALAIKHPSLSGKSKLYFHGVLFYRFLKPSEVYKSIQSIFDKPKNKVDFDTISNDWNRLNKLKLERMPKQDSTLSKSKFGVRPEQLIRTKQLIEPELVVLLENIKSILKKNQSNYKIVIVPSYNQLGINVQDLAILVKIFSKENIFDYSGNHLFSKDKFNFSDINHFDMIIGWKILEDIYETPN